MARRAFFSFHYDHVWRVNQIRNVPSVLGVAAAGFADSSLWEQAKETGPSAIQSLIDKALIGTSVTVVCVTLGVSQRRYINYEIDQSIARGNGLVAVQIHDLKDSNGQGSQPGAVPSQIARHGFKAYRYSGPEALASWIEEAAVLAGK